MSEELSKEMKVTHEEMKKKEYDLMKRKQEADNNLKQIERMRNDLKSINKQVNENKDKLNNHSEEIGKNQEDIERHDKQNDDMLQEIDGMYSKLENMESQINTNKSLNDEEKEMMKKEIYCEIIENTKIKIEQIEKTGGRGIEERIISSFNFEFFSTNFSSIIFFREFSISLILSSIPLPPVFSICSILIFVFSIISQ